jgi:hypothetical protein
MCYPGSDFRNVLAGYAKMTPQQLAGVADAGEEAHRI